MSNLRSDSSASEPTIFPRDEHCISRDDIDPDALKIMYRLLRYGYKAFLVGGGVRDLLLGKRPKDFDISTDATPRRIKEIFRNSRIIGRRFKLVHVYFRGNKIIELSTFRDVSDPIDLESDQERPNGPAQDNKYGTEVTDALRRDITINGLFYDLSTFSIIDYVGGMHDLRAGIIRVIGDPDVRFPEDPVRMIRVVRHAVRSGFTIDSATWDSLLRNHKLICDVAAVRVFEEIKKDLTSGHCLGIFRLLAQAKLFEYILPQASANDARLLAPGSELARTMGDVDRLIQRGESISPSVLLSLIAYFTILNHSHESGQSFDENDLHDSIRDCFADLAVPKREKERIELVIRDWEKLREASPQKIRVGQFARKPHLEDLIQFGRIVSSDDDHTVRLLQRAQSSDVHDEREQNQRRRRERQSPSRPTTPRRTGSRT